MITLGKQSMCMWGSKWVFWVNIGLDRYNEKYSSFNWEIWYWHQQSWGISWCVWSACYHRDVCTFTKNGL